MQQLRWTKIGQFNPYWGVINHPRYLSMTEEKRTEFFQSGEAHIARVLGTLEKHFGPYKSLQSALDFGCGAGRLVIPLAKRSARVTGIDISSSMIWEAKKNCEEQELSNVTFSPSLDDIPLHSFDLVHSFIVIQHIPPKVGFQRILALIDRVKPGGRGMLHFTFEDRFPLLKRFGLCLRRNSTLFDVGCNLLQGRKWNTPHIPMYTYNLPQVFSAFYEKGIVDLQVTIEEHGAYRGLCCYFQVQ